MSFQGDISSLPLSDVVQNLAANKKSGTLTIYNDDVERYVQFQDGKIVSYADNQGFSIAQWLADKEILPPTEYEEALRRHRRAKKKSLGKILHDLGALELEDFSAYYHELVKETLYEVLSFQEGTFKFHENNLSEKYSDREARALNVTLAAASVLMESARRMDDWQRIRRHIPSENEIYHVPAAERNALLKRAEDDVSRGAIELLDGTRSLREVIAKLPYGRFDACSALAQLIAEKKIRPLDGSELMERQDEDPRQLIACLKTILEREPNNREILKRLAEVQTEQGLRDDSATCYKLLAISHLEDGDLAEGEKSLRRSLKLNPKDIGTWQKLWDVVKRQGEREKIASVGREYAAHFARLGLLEVARDQLLEMVDLFPQATDLRLRLADARFALGEKKECIQGLFELAREFLRRERMDDAEKVFARILKYDRSNPKAKEMYEKLHSGSLARRRAVRRKLVRWALAALLLIACSGFLAYDFCARGELLRATKTVFAESLLERQRYDEAINRIQGVRDKYPLTPTANYEARALLETLEQKKDKARTRSPRP